MYYMDAPWCRGRQLGWSSEHSTRSWRMTVFYAYSKFICTPGSWMIEIPRTSSIMMVAGQMSTSVSQALVNIIYKLPRTKDLQTWLYLPRTERPSTCRYCILSPTSGWLLALYFMRRMTWYIVILDPLRPRSPNHAYRVGRTFIIGPAGSGSITQPHSAA